VILTEHGAPVVAIISMDDLAELQAAADTVDVALAERIMAEGKPGDLAAAPGTATSSRLRHA
jgi:hypothetical protein